MKKELKDFIYFMDEENIEKLNKEICKNFYLKNEEIKHLEFIFLKLMITKKEYLF